MKKQIAWYGSVVIGAVYSAGMIWWAVRKYASGGYNGLDLAIFNQVLWNIANRGTVWSSIQGHSYFGDHFAPFLFALAPLYALWQDPRFLLVLQAVALGATVIPVYGIARLFLSASGVSRSYGVWFAASWMAVPFLYNMALYEFHLLPFALLFLLCALWSFLSAEYSSSRRSARTWMIAFFVFSGLAITVREDVSLVVGAIGAVMVLRQRKRRDATARSIRRAGAGTMAAAAAWLAFSHSIIAAFSPSGQYAFGIYYGWLFHNLSPAGIAAGMAQRIFSLAHLNLLVGILLPFLFLPLTRPLWLVLAVPAWAGTVLMDRVPSSVVWQTHFVSLWLPSLVCGTAAGYARIAGALRRKGLPAGIVPIALFAAAIMSAAVMGPRFTDYAFAGEMRETVGKIPPTASVAATYRLQAPLSSRPFLYDVRYIWLGRQQYSSVPYSFIIPEYIALAREDVVSYFVQFPALGWTRQSHGSGEQRFLSLIRAGNYGVVQDTGEFLLLKKGAVSGSRAGISYISAWIEEARALARSCPGGVQLAPDRSLKVVFDC